MGEHEKGLKEIRIVMYEQNENINQKQKLFKPNSGAEKYNKWIEVFNTVVQQQTQTGKRIRDLRKWIIWNHWIGGAKKKKKKIEPKGFLGHIKVSSLGSSRKGRETGRGQSLFEKNNGQNFPKLEERNGYTNLGTSTNFN